MEHSIYASCVNNSCIILYGEPVDTLFWEVLLSVTSQVGWLQEADINPWKEMGSIQPGQYNRASILSHFLLMTWASALDTLPTNFCYKSSLT